MPDTAPNTISLSLVSHTNVGKTTLARTLLTRSVGEVRDEAHVTDEADRFELCKTPEGDLLLLWDTPGFGDSARLARRLLQSDKPIGWFVSQLWDRFADRPLWSSQQAVRNVREEADVVLYLVNASENPEDASYVEPEMKIIAWIGKPIIVLLNQMGPPAGHKAEAAEIERWRTYLSRFGDVKQVLALDAFARCWVQEGALLQAVAPLLSEAKQPAFERLNTLWQNQRRNTFDQSMQILAERLASTALDRERIPNSSLKDQLWDVGKEMGKVLGISREKQEDAKAKAMSQLAERLNSAIRQSTDDLIHAHGLEGHASEDVLNRLADHYDVSETLNESHAAMVGGIVTGALAGLKADVFSGGLTLGGGMIAGGVLGALGGAGLARGYNMVRGLDAVTVTWTDAVMNRLVQSALLTYLAVAHYGRGRGEWAAAEHPAHWEKTVTDVLVQQNEQFTQFWRKRQNYGPDALTSALQTELTLAMERILIRLYPNSLSMAALGSGAKKLNIALANDLAAASGDAARKQQEERPEEPEHAATLRAGFAAAGIGSDGKRLPVTDLDDESASAADASGNTAASPVSAATRPHASADPQADANNSSISRSPAALGLFSAAAIPSAPTAGSGTSAAGTTKAATNAVRANVSGPNAAASTHADQSTSAPSGASGPITAGISTPNGKDTDASTPSSASPAAPVSASGGASAAVHGASGTTPAMPSSAPSGNDKATAAAGTPSANTPASRKPTSGSGKAGGSKHRAKRRK
ncbi:MAG: DUF3482 domain-containing protein [Lautropia sp.]|nr:DUF3482 domain-containing protein [Lautropia sp.]